MACSKLSPDALEAAIPASLVGTVARELDELAPDERQAIDARERRRRRVLALAGGACGRTWTSSRSNRCSRCSRAAARSSCAKASWSWPTACSARSIASRTGSTRRSCSITCRRARASAAHARAGLAMERVFSGREHEAAADLACHFHGAGDHLRAARYLRLAAGNALKRYAPREAAALLHGAVTHASHLEPDERTPIELPLLLELGQAQLAAGETEPRDTDADQTRAARRRRAAARRPASGAPDADRSAHRRVARGRARMRATRSSRRAARHRHRAGGDGGDPRRHHRAALRGLVRRDRRPLPRRVARPPASSDRTNIGTLAIRLFFLHTYAQPTPAPGRAAEAACRGARQRQRRGLRLLLLHRSASPRCTSDAGTMRTRCRARGRRCQRANRHDTLCGHRCGSCRHGSRSSSSASRTRIV